MFIIFFFLNWFPDTINGHFLKLIISTLNKQYIFFDLFK